MNSNKFPQQGFELHPQLAKDSSLVHQLALSQVRVIHDANYPWFLLIPCIEGLRELHQLSESQQQILTKESRLLSICIENCFRPDKLNVACIGNMVEQLHVHHIARYTSDIAWPKPVWGFTKPLAYQADKLEQVKAELKHALLQQQNDKE